MLVQEILYLSDCILLMQLRHLWSNCKMLWATHPEFECIKKNSNLEWNLILVSWAFFYTHDTVEKKAIEENFFPVQLLLFDMVAFILLYFQKKKINHTLYWGFLHLEKYINVFNKIDDFWTLYDENWLLPLMSIAQTYLQTPLPLPEFFPICQWNRFK